MDLNAPDLTRRPPRSPRVRLGGYAILPRILDKGRATIAGTNGEYIYNAPMDQHFLTFAGIDADALKAELALGKSDSEIIEWITSHSSTKPSIQEIIAWSAYQDQRGPTDLETRQFLNEFQAKNAPGRKDVFTWFEALDIEDFVSFGGKA